MNNTNNKRDLIHLIIIIAVMLFSIAIIYMIIQNRPGESNIGQTNSKDNSIERDYESVTRSFEPTPTSSPEKVKSSKVSASSYYTQKDGKKLTPNLACDANLKTAWNVRGHKETDGAGDKKTVTTNGVGEFINFEFEPGTKLYSVTICPGFCFNDKKVNRFDKNFAPTNITISYGSISFDIDLTDYAYDIKKASKGCTYIFPDWIEINGGSVRLTINSVRNVYKEKGKEYWKDCCISEILFSGSSVGTSKSKDDTKSSNTSKNTKSTKNTETSETKDKNAKSAFLRYLYEQYEKADTYINDLPVFYSNSHIWKDFMINDFDGDGQKELIIHLSFYTGDPSNESGDMFNFYECKDGKVVQTDYSLAHIGFDYDYYWGHSLFNDKKVIIEEGDSEWFFYTFSKKIRDKFGLKDGQYLYYVRENSDDDNMLFRRDICSSFAVEESEIIDYETFRKEIDYLDSGDLLDIVVYPATQKGIDLIDGIPLP